MQRFLSLIVSWNFEPQPQTTESVSHKFLLRSCDTQIWSVSFKITGILYSVQVFKAINTKLRLKLLSSQRFGWNYYLLSVSIFFSEHQTLLCLFSLDLLHIHLGYNTLLLMKSPFWKEFDLKCKIREVKSQFRCKSLSKPSHWSVWHKRTKSVQELEIVC